MSAVIFDTGVIIGSLLSADQHHNRCEKFMREFKGTRLLPVTVFSETLGMLERWPNAEAAFVASVRERFFVLVQLVDDDLIRIEELVKQYGDFPLGGVDASIIAIAERLHIDTVTTIDHRHFRAVVPHHVAALTLVPA